MLRRVNKFRARRAAWRSLIGEGAWAVREGTCAFDASRMPEDGDAAVRRVRGEHTRTLSLSLRQRRSDAPWRPSVAPEEARPFPPTGSHPWLPGYARLPSRLLFLRLFSFISREHFDRST